MTTTWAVLLLLSLLTLLNTAAVIGLIRQVGVLHVRLQPLPALQGAGGPGRGAQLRFETPPWELPQIDPGVERIVLAFFSPTCRLCGPLLPALESLAKSREPSIEYVLVTDADGLRAAEYLRSNRIRIPFVAEQDVFATNDIPAAPFVVVTDRAGAVLASGGVNTLEQIEWVLEASEVPPGEEHHAAGDDHPDVRAGWQNGRREEVIGVVD